MNALDVRRFASLPRSDFFLCWLIFFAAAGYLLSPITWPRLALAFVSAIALSIGVGALHCALVARYLR